MSSSFDIQPIGRFVGPSAPVKRPRVRVFSMSVVCDGEDEMDESDGILSSTFWGSMS